MICVFWPYQHIRITLGLLYCQYDMKSLQLSKPHLLIVVGGPGSGKSTFATKFSETFHAPFIDGGRIASYTHDSQTASRLIAGIMSEVQKTNQTIIYEPITGTRTERAEIAKMASKAGYSPLLIWVQTDKYVAESRATRKSRTNPHPIDAEEFERATKRFTTPGPNEKHVVISGMHTYATQAKAVLRRLSDSSAARTSTTPAPARPTQQSMPRRSVTVQ